MKSEPLMLPGRHAMNLALLAGNVGAMGTYMMTNNPTIGLSMLGTTTALSSVMGVTLTMAIGGLYAKVHHSKFHCMLEYIIPISVKIR